MFNFKPEHPNTSSISRDTTAYTPLRDDLSSPSEKDDQERTFSYLRYSANHNSSRVLSYATIFLLIVTNALTITDLVTTKSQLVRLDATKREYIPKSAGSSLLV